MRANIKYLAWFLLAAFACPTAALERTKTFPLTMTIWETWAYFSKPDGAMTHCTILGPNPTCSSTDMQLQTLIELVSLASVADGKIYVIKCVSRIWRQADLDDLVRLGIVSPGDYKARRDKEKLKVQFYGKNGRWNELTFAIKTSSALTPEMERKLSEERRLANETK
jgi:hypothetical protein